MGMKGVLTICKMLLFVTTASVITWIVVEYVLPNIISLLLGNDGWSYIKISPLSINGYKFIARPRLRDDIRTCRNREVQIRMCLQNISNYTFEFEKLRLCRYYAMSPFSALICGQLCEVTIWGFSQKFQIWMTRICNLEKEWNNIIGT